MICIGLVVLAACGQKNPGDEVSGQVIQLQAQALKSDLAWSLLHALTTEAGPRMAGSPGDERAVEWASSIMETMGFDTVWIEPVSFPRWRRGTENAWLFSSYPLPLVVSALGGSPGTGGPVRGEVVPFATMQGLRDAPVETVQGKIVFIGERMQASREASGYAKVVMARVEGPYLAAQKGASALIIRSVGTDNNRLAHTGAMEPAKGRVAVPAAAISNPDADMLQSLVDSGKPLELELMLDCGFDGAATSYNVIGEISGTDPDAGYFAMGAHLDSWDLGTGAIDDGAGVAIVLATARMIADLPQRPRRGLRVILFANEEQGMYGSREYARAHRHELKHHFAGAESDLGAGPVYLLRASVAPGAQAAMLDLAELLQPLGIDYDSSQAANGGADLGYMSKLGMPAIDLVQDASRYFDYHHTANDTLDKVDAAELRQNVAAWVTTAWFMANTEAELGPISASH